MSLYLRGKGENDSWNMGTNTSNLDEACCSTVSTLVGIGNVLVLVSSPVPSVVSPKVKITNNTEFCFCGIADPELPNKEQADGFGAERGPAAMHLAHLISRLSSV